MPSSAKVKESKGLKTFSASEVVNHRRKEDLYVVIHDKVYDITSFVEHHPQVSSAASTATGRFWTSLTCLAGVGRKYLLTKEATTLRKHSRRSDIARMHGSNSPSS
jgi:hypothetical protein